MRLDGGIDPHREYALVEQPADDIRDAMNVWVEADDSSVAMRLGIEALGANWTAHDLWVDIAFADQRVLSFRGSAPNTTARDDLGVASIMSAGGMRFDCIIPFVEWRVRYQGEVEALTAQQLARGVVGSVSDTDERIPVDIDLQLSMQVPPWIPGTLSRDAAQFMAGSDGQFMSPRYEQLFAAEGTTRIAGVTQAFSGKGLRIRRTGPRQFSGFRGHCWQSAVFPDGRAFGYNTYPPEPGAQHHYREGFIFNGKERIPAVPVEIPWLRELRAAGDDISCALETDAGEVVRINGNTFINTRSRSHVSLPPDFPVVQQAHARYVWEGASTVGMIERSSLPTLIQHTEAS